MNTIKQTCTILFIILISIRANAQNNDLKPNIALKWSPAGMFLGSLNFQGEYNFGKNSLTAKIGVPVAAHHMLKYNDQDSDFDLKAMSFMAGYRTYLSKKHMKGLYFEPYFKYVHHTAEGQGKSTLTGEPVVMEFTNDYNGVGVGAQLGAQFLIAKRIVVDLFFLGPEINSARNNFKAVETTNVIPWTYAQANEAEQDIRDFIDKFPFIRNKSNIMVDQLNKTVTVDFKGTLPGFRAGVSIGFAF